MKKLFVKIGANPCVGVHFIKQRRWWIVLVLR